MSQYFLLQNTTNYEGEEGKSHFDFKGFHWNKLNRKKSVDNEAEWSYFKTVSVPVIR